MPGRNMTEQEQKTWDQMIAMNLITLCDSKFDMEQPDHVLNAHARGSVALLRDLFDRGGTSMEDFLARYNVITR